MSKKIRNFFIIILILCAIAAAILYFYTTYNDINITPEYEIQKTESTVPLQTVENATKENLSVADMLEEVSQSVVGISRIKSHSNSIFSSCCADITIVSILIGILLLYSTVTCTLPSGFK